ncbi:MAG: recombination mediator RecR, partial [Rhodospirillales bacterium]
VHPCSRCHQVTDIDPCGICSDTGRDDTVICVVERPAEVLAVEESGAYRGRYHVLGGALDPLGGIGPEALHIESLERRVHDGKVRELILATNAGVEGEATATYLAQRLSRDGLRISRPAQGLPVGGELGYTDRLTLARALQGRHAVD